MRSRVVVAVRVAVLALLTFLAVIAFVAPVAAQPAGTAQAGPNAVVVVAVRGSDEDVAALHLLLDELLARINLQPAVTPGAPEGEKADPSAFATVLVDATGRNIASVAVQEGAAGRVRLLRQIEHAGSRALLIDTAAHVIYAMLDTMVRERLARSDPRSPASTEAPAPERSAPVALVAAAATPSALTQPRWGVDLSPFYGVRAFAGPQQSAMMNAGLALSAGARAGRLQPSLSISASYGLDVALGAPAGMPEQGLGRMQVISLHAMPVVNVIGRGRLLLQAGLGGGLDVVRLETPPPPTMGPMGPGGPPGPTGPGNPSPTPTQSRHVDPLIGTRLVARLAITTGTHLFVAGAADYGPSYLIQMGFGSVAPLQMPHWRFEGSLGLSVTLGGRAPGWTPTP